MDSWKPRKLEPGFEQTYSIPRDLMTSTMKSEPLRSSVRIAAAGRGAPISASRDIDGGGFLPVLAGVFDGATAGVAATAAPATALFRKSRRWMPVLGGLAMVAPLVGFLLSHRGSAGYNLVEETTRSHDTG